MPEGAAKHSFLGCNRRSTCIPSYSLYVQLLWYPMYYPGGMKMKAQVSPVQWSKPYSILAPTRDSNPGGPIQNHKRWPLHYHCTLSLMIRWCELGIPRVVGVVRWGRLNSLGTSSTWMWKTWVKDRSSWTSEVAIEWREFWRVFGFKIFSFYFLLMIKRTIELNMNHLKWSSTLQPHSQMIIFSQNLVITVHGCPYFLCVRHSL